MPKGHEHVKEDWSGDREDYISQLQARIQRLEQENTDFLAALEDAMEQYKQQVRALKSLSKMCFWMNFNYAIFHLELEINTFSKVLEKLFL